MIQKYWKKRNLNDPTSSQDDLAFWLSKTPEERIATVAVCEDNIMEVEPDFRDVLELFNAHKVEYMIV